MEPARLSLLEVVLQRKKVCVVVNEAGVVSGLFSFCRQANYLPISLGFQGFYQITAGKFG
jgi:hypothetical protein